MRRQNPLHTAALRHHACASCGARAGEPCRKANGRGIAWPPHKPRIDAEQAFRAASGNLYPKGRGA